MGHIDWLPIAEISDDLDGEYLLFWCDNGEVISGEWTFIQETPTSVTHFAEINPPS